MKKTGWIYVSSGMLPAVDSTWEASYLDGYGKPDVERMRFYAGSQMWYFDNDNETICTTVYAYRSLPEPAPREGK